MGGDAMIELTRFDGSRFFVNAEYIEFVEATPDTVISLIDHKKLLVREPAPEVVERILRYQSAVGANAPARLTALARWTTHPQHTETSEAADDPHHPDEKGRH
jgi:flagellar protein FlbD